MGDFKINEKTVFTQSGSAEPAMGSTITGIPAAGITGVLPVGVTVSELNFGTNKGETTSLEADIWRVTTEFATTATYITSNWERCDDSGYDYLGGGITESSGVFTFPSIGLYQVDFNTYVSRSASVDFVDINIYTTIDNSAYTTRAFARTSLVASAFANPRAFMSAKVLFNVTSVTNCKCKFHASALDSTSFKASSTKNVTYATFTKIGEVN